MFTIVFLVRYTYPRYDHITDALIGHGNTIADAFGTYWEAMDYLYENFDQPVDADDVVPYVTMDVTYELTNGLTVGRERSVTELKADTQYYGPVSTDSVPF